MADVVLYTRDWCSYSDAARALLERKGVAFEEINATVGSVLAGDDAEQHFDLFAALTSRYDYAGPDGPGRRRGVEAAVRHPRAGPRCPAGCRSASR